jgi:2-C-methyl-D-erythritol 4-phosphate cytidylyltransferase
MIGKEKVGAIIAAAGSSQRMKGIDKIFADLDGVPVLSRVIEVFQESAAVDEIVIVISQSNLEMGKSLVSANSWPKVTGIYAGGERRQDSVIRGLEELHNCNWVIIHDGARPLVTNELIQQGLDAAMETGAAIAAIPVTDTIKVAGDDLIVQGTPPRRNLWAIQTPQVFRFNIIDSAYKQLKYEVSDDAGAVELLGHKVKLYQGSYDNIKITTPNDIAIAGVLRRKHDR